MAKFFIDRPIFAWVIAIILMLAGIASVFTLPIAQYPTIAPPAVQISASYPGASAKTVENTVTQVIEQQMSGLDHLLYLSSTSDDSGTATITLTFAAGTNPDIAQVQVQNKLQLATPLLPQAVQQLGTKAQVLKTLQPYALMVNIVAQPGLSQDSLQRLLRAARRGIDLLNREPARAQALLATRWQADAKAVSERLDGYDFRLTLNQNLLSTLEAESRWAVREDLVDRGGKPDFLGVMRVEPLRALDPRAVTLIK